MGGTPNNPGGLRVGAAFKFSPSKAYTEHILSICDLRTIKIGSGRHAGSDIYAGMKREEFG